MGPEAELRAPDAILEENLEWIRDLARSLVRDPDRAEDLAQDTVVAALEIAPGAVRLPRPWLATVARNLWRHRGRTEERRRARESESAIDRNSGDDLVERVVVFREVAQYVLDLHEPYRSAVLMRFWEGLPPRAIAARLDTTPATIQNRIARALALLRERMDRSRGGREAWLSALLPCIRPPASGPAALLGGIAVNAKIAVAAALVLAVVAYFAFRGLDAPSAPSAPALAAKDAPAVAERTAPASSATPLAEPTAADAPASERATLGSAPATAAPDPAPSTRFHVRGRVLDATASPVSGLSIRAADGGPVLATSRDGGWFELDVEEDVARCVSADPAWTTVRSAALRRNAKLEPVLVVARSLDVQGIVQDVRGAPLASARVHFDLPPGFEARFDRPLEASIGMGFGATTDERGRFALPGLPSVEGSKLSAVLEGYARAEIDEPIFGAADVVLVLAPPAKAPEGSLEGRVVDDVGRPVAKARVFLGLASVATDERGEFAVDFARAVTSDRIVAVASGWRPASMDRPREPRGSDTGWPPSVVLAFPGPVLSISGTVVDAKGEGVPGIRVSIVDPSPIGAIGMMPAHAEFLAAGAPIPPQALASESQMPPKDGDHYHDLTMNVGPPTAFFHYVTTDARGRFEIGGLDDRRYRLQLADPKTCSRSSTGEHRAGGPPLQLRWEPEPLLRKVAGRVLGEDGKPVAGARVGLSRRAFAAGGRVYGGRVDVILSDQRERATTGEDGRFEYHDVPSKGIVLSVTGEGILEGSFDLETSGDPESLELRVHQRCSFEVVVKSPGLEADAIGLRDSEGKVVDVLRIDSENVNAYTTVTLVDRRSGVVSASSAARELVLLLGETTVRTVPIELRAGEVTRIEL